MLGTSVPVDSPFNPLFVTNLQCRNIRISVTNQKSIISMELYDKDQPIEQFNSSIMVPVKSTHDTKYNDIKPDPESEKSSVNSTTHSQTWQSDMRKYANTSTLKVPTLTSGNVNYLVGITSDYLKR